MYGWIKFKNAAPDISSAGTRLLERNEVAFLATVSSTERPRIHPFVPKIVEGKMLAFIMDSSPKFEDLKVRTQYSMHTLPGPEDEEFFISGSALYCDGDIYLRELAADAMGFVTGIDEHHRLFEFQVDRALWTRWLDFGKPAHRPKYLHWNL